MRHSSIDLVCFSWVEENQDDEDYENNDEDDDDDDEDEDDDTEISAYGTVVTTPVTI